MAREAFVATPFVMVEISDLRVRPHTGRNGEPSVVLDLGPALTLHVYDPALLARLAEVVAEGRELLDAGLAGQDPLPVDTQLPDDEGLVTAGRCSGLVE